MTQSSGTSSISKPARPLEEDDSHDDGGVNVDDGDGRVDVDDGDGGVDVDDGAFLIMWIGKVKTISVFECDDEDLKRS